MQNSCHTLMKLTIWNKCLLNFKTYCITSWKQICVLKFWQLGIFGTVFTYLQGAIKKRGKSNHIFWCKNRVKFLFLAHYLQGNISPFTFIIFTTLWFYLFWSKFSIQKMPKIAILWPFWLIYLTEWPIMGSFDNPESTEGPIVVTWYNKSLFGRL